MNAEKPGTDPNFHGADTDDVIVIGAGQAGLAAGYFLQRAGVRFTLLDGGDAVGDAWRHRWDSLRLFTPARYNALPGSAFPGEAYSLPGKDDVADYLAAYARRFQLPIRLRTRVTALRRGGRGFSLATSDGELHARAVIVATGANQRPYVPPFAPALDAHITQLHSSAYRRPSQLPEGTVLVVGAGNSGTQIAMELARSGREVLLAGRSPGALPRRVLGRDVYDWLWPTLMRATVDSCIGERLLRGRLFAGDPLVGIREAAIAAAGVKRVDRFDGTRLPAGIAAIVWCTGFRPDYGWIEAPVLGLDGYPAHRRGIVRETPGLAFLGMRFMHRMGSALLGGVGEDAAFVVRRTVEGIR